MLHVAVEIVVADFLQKYADNRNDPGRHLVVRHGHLSTGWQVAGQYPPSTEVTQCTTNREVSIVEERIKLGWMSFQSTELT